VQMCLAFGGLLVVKKLRLVFERNYAAGSQFCSRARGWRRHRTHPSLLNLLKGKASEASEGRNARSIRKKRVSLGGIAAANGGYVLILNSSS
jgi:hypothetical protein